MDAWRMGGALLEIVCQLPVWLRMLNKYYQEEIETRFFNFYLKGKGSFDQSEVTVFETGSNQWKNYDAGHHKTVSLIAYYCDRQRVNFRQKAGCSQKSQ